MYEPESYHLVQEMQKYNISDNRPHLQHFQDAIRKVRQVQRMKKQRGFAFSQTEEGGQEKIIRMYDTTQKRGVYGELHDASLNPFSDSFAVSKTAQATSQNRKDDVNVIDNPFGDSNADASHSTLPDLQANNDNDLLDDDTSFGL